MKKLLFPLFSRRAFRAYAWIFVTVLTILLLFRQYINWSGTKRWVAVQEELAKEGESIDFRKVTPEPVPDDQNFCAIPLLKDLASTPVFTDDKSEAGLHRQRLVDAALPKNDKAGPRPGYSQGPELGKKMNLQDWAEWLRKEGSLPMPSDAGDPAKDILTALKKDDALINELAAGLTRPGAQWTPPWKTRTLPENLFEVSLPHYTVIRELTQMLCFRSIVAARAGDVIKAHEALLIATRINQATMQEPFLIGLLVASANSNFISSAVWELCNTHTGKAADFHRLQKELAQMNHRKSALHAWRGELASIVDATAYMKRTRDARTIQVTDGPTQVYRNNLTALAFHLIPDGFFDANAASIARWNLDYNIKPLRDGDVNAFLAKQTELEALIIEHKGQFSYQHFDEMLALIVMPATVKIAVRVSYTQSLMNEAIISCALERYRIEHDSYPDKLAEVYEAETLPKDMISGAPLGYRRTEEGRYKLWSVGFDGKDDGAKRVLDENKPDSTRFHDAKYVGDWVWDFPVR